MDKRYRWLITLLLLFALACALVETPQPTTPTAQVSTPTAPPSPPASPTGNVTTAPVEWVTPPAVALQGLQDAVVASLPPQAFSCYHILPLEAPPQQAPLWAVYSCGMTNWEHNPVQPHVLAIYTLQNAVWTELARITFDDAVMIDYLPEDGVHQIRLDPAHVCLEVNGGVGAHGGSYGIVRFTGNSLEVLISNGSAEPLGAGYTADLNQDGQLDVVLNQTDAYIFCYACGVRKVAYSLYTWDTTQAALRQITLHPASNALPTALRDAVNDAVALAQAGLWRDAQQQITQALTPPPAVAASDYQDLMWLKAYIDLQAQGKAQAITGGYPLLQYVYYGDYAGAVDLMRSYTPQQVFDRNGPLIAGTVVDMAPETLAQELMTSANAALGVKPDLAAAYFLRGWAAFLMNNPGNAQQDVQHAAQLAPTDPFYMACASYLQNLP